MKAIILGKDYWMNSMFSVARYYGGITIDGDDYLIVPPADDLVRKDWLKVYTKYGREKVLESLRNGILDVRKVNEYLSPKEPERTKETPIDTQLNLFD